jgi:thiamine biosynthesis lipoprotein
MGTGVTIDIPGVKERRVFDDVFSLLKRIDRDYSTYKKDSIISRFNRGELRWWQKNREFRNILKACAQAETETDGAFSAYAGGSFDPSGYVKGWSIQQAALLIEKAGHATYCISIGGDIKAAGDKLWKIGIQDPKNKNRSLLTLNVKDRSVATSGNYIRGAHIINPKTGQPAKEITSVTVVGPNIIDADVLATAAFVLGEFGLNLIGAQAKGYEAFMVGKSGLLSASPGFEQYMDQL